tara:strand:+ start:365 stop:616 length:252 start_codon:yes stop_codon:yes gene_type:complete
MIKEGTIVKGNRNNETVSGVITKTKTHKRKSAAYGRSEVELEITLAEVLFQVEGNERAIYAYVEDEFYMIKDTIAAPAGLELA